MIFVTGPHAAGKTFFAQKLQKAGFDFIDLGPTLRGIWKEISPELSFGEFIQNGESQNGTHFTDDLLVTEVSKRLMELKVSGNTRDLLIIGSRSATGIEYLRGHVANHNGKNPCVIYIDAPENELHIRYNLREGKNLTLEEFRLILQEDETMGLEGIQRIANHFLTNIGNPEQFSLKIETLVFGQLGYERKINGSIDIERN